MQTPDLTAGNIDAYLAEQSAKDKQISEDQRDDLRTRCRN